MEANRLLAEDRFAEDELKRAQQAYEEADRPPGSKSLGELMR
jgi:hypothetical protein